MKVYKELNVLTGILLLASSISRFFQVFLDPASNLIFFFMFTDFSGERLFSLLGGSIIGFGIFFIIAAILGYVYSAIYFALGLSVLVLRAKKSLVKTCMGITLVSIFLEIRTIIILSTANYICIFMIIQFIIDLVIFSMSLYIFLKLREHKKTIKQERQFIVEEMPKSEGQNI